MEPASPELAPRLRSSSPEQRGQPFTPKKIDQSLCLARTWNEGRGGQCSKRKHQGDFCKTHLAKWMVHGRVDGEVPEKKLREFEAATPGRKRSRDDGASGTPQSTPIKAPKIGCSGRGAAAASARAASAGQSSAECSADAKKYDLEVLPPLPPPASTSTARPTEEEEQSSEEGSKADFLSAVQAVPDLSGAVAELLWSWEETQEVCPDSGLVRRRRVGCPDLGQLLLAGQSARLALVVGVKERRAVAHRQSALESQKYQQLCNALEKACPEAWTTSRELRQHTTDEAELQAVLRHLEGMRSSPPSSGSP